jgi:predicted phosphatase
VGYKKISLREKFIVISAYIKKKELLNNLMMHLKVLEKQEVKPQISRRK